MLLQLVLVLTRSLQANLWTHKGAYYLLGTVTDGKKDVYIGLHKSKDGLSWPGKPLVLSNATYIRISARCCEFLK